MKKLARGVVLVCLAAGLAAEGAFARPGGRGGMRPGGAPGRGTGAAGAWHPADSAWSGPARGSGLLPQAGGIDRHGQPPRVDDYRRFFDGQRPEGGHQPAQRRQATAYGWANPAQRPFTPAWYADHPKAWQATHPHADVVAAAGAVGLARWLAVSSVWVGGQTVIYSDDMTPATTDSVPASQPPSYETSSAASTWADSAGHAAEDGRWMTIGEFALGPEGRGDATRVIRLLVSQDGVVRGSHYDLISEEVQEVRGAVDKKELRIAWRIGPSGKVVFQAPLGELTNAEGRLTAYFPDGKRATWRAVRVEE
jgi:hypothetical protein